MNLNTEHNDPSSSALTVVALMVHVPTAIKHQVAVTASNIWPLPPSFLQVFVETLDRCFENVCELDLIFHVDKVHNILQEICLGGMVLETNMSEILTHIEEQNRLEKSEATATSAIRVGGTHTIHTHTYSA